MNCFLFYFLIMILLINVSISQSRDHSNSKTLLADDSTKLVLPVLSNPDVKKIKADILNEKRGLKRKEVKKEKKTKKEDSDSSNDEMSLRASKNDGLVYDIDSDNLRVEWK